MNGEVRRIFEMAARAERFSDAQPDTDAGHAVLVGRLKQVRAEMEQVATIQRAGLIDVHTGAVEKRRLRREMLAGPIAHLAEVAGMAKREHPDLVNRLRYKPSGVTYVAHRTAARSMQAEATTNKEVLGKFGLSEAVLEVFGQLLDQFDAAVKVGSDGRAAQPGPRSGSGHSRSRRDRSCGRWTRGAGTGSRTTSRCWGRGSTPVRCSGGARARRRRKRRDLRRGRRRAVM